MERRYLIPEWEGSSFQQWAKNYCARNAWRVANVLGDYSDCLSECALIWVECCKRYGETVDNAAWLMRLYQICVITTFDTISVRDSNNKKLQVKLTERPLSEEIESDANLAVKLNNASGELKAVLKVFINAPQEIMEVIRQEANSCHPKQFFKAVVEHCGISKTKSPALAKELLELLSR